MAQGGFFLEDFDLSWQLILAGGEGRLPNSV